MKYCKTYVNPSYIYKHQFLDNYEKEYGERICEEKVDALSLI